MRQASKFPILHIVWHRPPLHKSKGLVKFKSQIVSEGIQLDCQNVTLVT